MKRLRLFRRTPEEEEIARVSMRQLTPEERRSVAWAVGLGVLAAGLLAGLIWFVIGVVILSR